MDFEHVSTVCGIDISTWNDIPAYARLTCNDASHLGRQP